MSIKCLLFGCKWEDIGWAHFGGRFMRMHRCERCAAFRYRGDE